MHLHEEVVGGTDTDRHGFAEGHAEVALQPAAGGFGHLRIQADVQIGIGDPHQIVNAGFKRGHHADVDAVHGEQLLHFKDVITAAKAEQ